jgi:hypothetical protein
MAFLTGTVEFKTYTDTSQTEFPKELVPHIKKDFSNTSITEIQSTTISLAALGSQAITLNGVSPVTKWYLYSDTTALTLTINGSATTFTYEAGMPGYIPIALTSLTIVNASAVSATTVTLVLIA